MKNMRPSIIAETITYRLVEQILAVTGKPIYRLESKAQDALGTDYWAPMLTFNTATRLINRRADLDETYVIEAFLDLIKALDNAQRCRDEEAKNTRL